MTESSSIKKIKISDDDKRLIKQTKHREPMTIIINKIVDIKKTVNHLTSGNTIPLSDTVISSYKSDLDNFSITVNDFNTKYPFISTHTYKEKKRKKHKKMSSLNHEIALLHKKLGMNDTTENNKMSNTLDKNIYNKYLNTMIIQFNNLYRKYPCFMSSLKYNYPNKKTLITHTDNGKLLNIAHCLNLLQNQTMRNTYYEIIHDMNSIERAKEQKLQLQLLWKKKCNTTYNEEESKEKNDHDSQPPMLRKTSSRKKSRIIESSPESLIITKNTGNMMKKDYKDIQDNYFHNDTINNDSFNNLQSLNKLSHDISKNRGTMMKKDYSDISNQTVDYNTPTMKNPMLRKTSSRKKSRIIESSPESLIITKNRGTMIKKDYNDNNHILNKITINMKHIIYNMPELISSKYIDSIKYRIKEDKIIKYFDAWLIILEFILYANSQKENLSIELSQRFAITSVASHNFFNLPIIKSLMKLCSNKIKSFEVLNLNQSNFIQVAKKAICSGNLYNIINILCIANHMKHTWNFKKFYICKENIKFLQENLYFFIDVLDDAECLQLLLQFKNSNTTQNTIISKIKILLDNCKLEKFFENIEGDFNIPRNLEQFCPTQIIDTARIYLKFLYDTELSQQ